MSKDDYVGGAHSGYIGWDSHEAVRLGREFQDQERERHKAKLEERKRDRETARRIAKGYTGSPTDYPWLKPDWVEPPVDPLRLRNRR